MGGAPAHGEVARHHQEARDVFAEVAPCRLVVLEHFVDGKLQVLLAFGEDFYGVVVDDARLHGEGGAVSERGGHFDLLGAQVVLDGERSVLLELE